MLLICSNFKSIYRPNHILRISQSIHLKIKRLSFQINDYDIIISLYIIVF